MKTVEWLFHEALKVDTEWSVKTPRGFRWWADRHAQTIEIIGEETAADGTTDYFVSVRTDVLRSLDMGDFELDGIHTIIMPFTSMAGPVYDRKTKTLSLCSLVRVHDAISQWMNPLISVAALLQIGEARIVRPSLAKVLDAENAVSGPPERGIRNEPDELAEIIAELIGPLGKQPSRWTAAEFTDTVNQYMRQPPAVAANAGGAGFTVEFPYGNGSSLFRVAADQPHPRYGNGLFSIQSFPVKDTSDPEGAKLALMLNRMELSERPFGYGFGSYAYRDRALHFTSFFPNALYRPGLLPNLYYSCSTRAREMSVRLLGIDWTHESFSQKRGALGKLFDLFMGQ